MSRNNMDDTFEEVPIERGASAMDAAPTTGNHAIHNPQDSDSDEDNNLRVRRNGPSQANGVTDEANEQNIANREEIAKIDFNVPPKPPRPSIEGKMVKRLIDMEDSKPMEVGESYYIISFRWCQKWRDYVRFERLEIDPTLPFDQQSPDDNDQVQNDPPPPIDNTELIDTDRNERLGNHKFLRLKIQLQENYHYLYLPGKVWKTLYTWYGGSPVIPRQVIEVGRVKHKQIDVYPLYLTLIRCNDAGHAASDTQRTFIISKRVTVGFLKKQCAKVYNLNYDRIRLWDYFHPTSAKLLEDMEDTVEEAMIIDKQQVLVEAQLDNNKWPRDDRLIMAHNQMAMGPSYRPYGNNMSYNRFDRSNEPPPEKGVAGLVNLGNTCFMNSSLQCLFNTEQLTKYFNSEYYKNEINRDNPLGMKGEIAEEYAALIKEIWSGTISFTPPARFKYTLGKFAPQFSGHQQQDSQELLAFLLDGLHEDLNRVIKKPYVKAIENENRGDIEVAKESWENHLKRNQSIIVDLFQGQFKSTLVCPECKKISITFDPFMYISLPLPIERDRIIEVILLKRDGSTPVRYGAKVPKEGSVKELKRELAKLAGLQASQLIIADVFAHRIFSYLEDSKRISEIRETDVTIGYEILPRPEVKEIVYSSSSHSAIVVRDPNAMEVTNENINEPPPAYTEHNTSNVGSNIIDFQLLHRQQEADPMYNYNPQYHRNPYRQVLWGTPFMLSVDKNITNKDLYHQIWDLVKRCFRRPKPQQEGGDSSSQQLTSNQQVGEPTSVGVTKEEIMQVEEVFRDNNLPFEVKLVNQMGTSCSKCPLTSSCQGCKVEYNDSLVDLRDKQILGIDWDMNVLQEYYDAEEAKNILQHESVGLSSKPERSSINLSDCFDLFTTAEQLGEEDPWFCPSCKKHQQATKKFDVFKAPTILVVHLKRFQSINRYWREKLSTTVAFPTTGLDLSPWIVLKDEAPPIYDLYAVSNHMGGLHGGHYTAYAKNFLDNKWYCFDDSNAYSVSESQIISSSAYVLFYRKRNVPELSYIQNITLSPVEKKDNNANDNSTTTVSIDNRPPEAHGDKTQKLD